MPVQRQLNPNGAAPSIFSGGLRPNQDYFGLLGLGYAIKDVPLIPQTKTMACWYASAQMLIQWRRARTVSCEISHPDPSEVPELIAEFVANDGLSISAVTNLAKDLGLHEVPPMTPSPSAIENWLRLHGPLWFAGLWPSGHAVVVTGITDSDIEINDPWPPNKGARRDLSFADFDRILQPLGAGTSLASNFLYFKD